MQTIIYGFGTHFIGIIAVNAYSVFISVKQRGFIYPVSFGMRKIYDLFRLLGKLCNFMLSLSDHYEIYGDQVGASLIKICTSLL